MYPNQYQSTYPYVYQQLPPQQPLTPRPTMPPAPQGLSGRMVGDISEVTPQEVPMNGTVSFFPKSDYTAIFAKCWAQDGTIQTFKFVPETPVDATAQKDPIAEINAKLDEIYSCIKPKPKTSRRTAKTEETEE